MTEERPEEETERRRPRVVDKRVSARGDAPPPEPAAPETPAPAPEPANREQSEVPDRTPPGSYPGTGPAGGPGAERVWTPEQEAEAQRLIEAMSTTPALDWVLNTCVTLANVAGVKIDTGELPGARLVIDALGELVDGLGDRLGEAHAPLKTTLAQLQLAYAQAATPPPTA